MKSIRFVMGVAILAMLGCGCTAVAPVPETQESTVESTQAIESSQAEESPASTQNAPVHPDTATNEIERQAYASIDEDIDEALLELRRNDWVGANEEVVKSTVFEPYEWGSLRYYNMDEDKQNLCTALAEAARNYRDFQMTSEEYGSNIVVPVLTADGTYRYTYLYESCYSMMELEGDDAVEILYFDPDGDGNDRIGKTPEEMEALRNKMLYMDAVIDRIIERMPEGLSTYEKYYYLALVLCVHCEYDKTDEADNATTAYGALTRGLVVCEGYAKAYVLLCQRANLYCVLENGISGGGGHMWNLIALETGTYHVDLTWCDMYDIKDYMWFMHFVSSQEECDAQGRELDLDNSYEASGKSLYE